MDLRKYEVQPVSSGVEKAAKITRGIARAAGRYAVNFTQGLVDIGHRAVGQRTYSKLEREATVNQVTGCYLRGALFDRLNSVIEDREPKHLTLSWVDLVKFADRINNPYGQAVGDSALAVAGWAIRTYFRNPKEEHSDSLVGSWGGDEFLAIAVGSDALNQRHPIFDGALRYNTEEEQAETGENRVVLYTAKLRENMEATGAPDAISAYPDLVDVLDNGITAIEFRFDTFLAEIDGPVGARRAVDQFVREYSSKGNARQNPRE